MLSAKLFFSKKLLEEGCSGVTTPKFSHVVFISPANITIFIA